jgi:hypothetical protein
VACSDDDADGDSSANETSTVTATATSTVEGTSSPTEQAGDLTEADVEGLVQNVVNTYNAGDPTAFRALFTEQGAAQFVEMPDASPPEVDAELSGYFEEPLPVNLREVRDIEIDDDKVSAKALLEMGHSLGIDSMTFVDQDGQWLLDEYGTAVESVEIPEGTEAVDVGMTEFAFDFDASAIPADGNVAFRIENNGDQLHEFVLVALDEGVEFPAVLTEGDPAGPPPEGLEFFAFGMAEPGDESTVVLTAPLPAGRYGIVCFIPDEDDPAETPHALKGMVSEFTIE